jgi:Ca-activated chloride channel family protein
MGSPSPNFVVTLTPTNPQHQNSCPLRATDVSIQVTGLIAQYQIKQRYLSNAPEPIEAIVRVPLPDFAAVRSIQVTQQGRTISSVVRETGAARAQYEAAVSQGQHAALAEEVRPNLMLLRVAQILPNVPVDVEIEIASQVDFEAGEASLAFPTTMTPRFITADTPTEEARKISPPFVKGERLYGISFLVEIDAKVPLTAVESDSHALVVSRLSPSTAIVSFKEGEVLPDRDILLRWRMQTSLSAPIVETARLQAGEAATVMLSLPPPAEIGEEEILPRHVTFLLDRSGSMGGEPMESAKRALKGFLRSLGPRDAFCIIAFDSSNETYGPVAFGDTALSGADQFLSNINARGGTSILPALQDSLSLQVPSGYVRTVVLLTDGSVSNEAQVNQAVAAGAKEKKLRAHAIGLGGAVNRSLVKGFARAGRGIAEFVPVAADLEPMLARFQARSGSPLATDLSIDYDGAPIVDITPQTPGDIDLGQPLLVFGRVLDSGTTTIIIRGRTFDIPFERKVSITIPAGIHGNAALPALWAKARVDELLEQGAQQNRDEILRVALKHHLMTPFTSLVAIERTFARKGVPPKEVEIPLHAPNQASDDVADMSRISGYSKQAMKDFKRSAPPVPSSVAPAPMRRPPAATMALDAPQERRKMASLPDPSAMRPPALPTNSAPPMSAPMAPPPRPASMAPREKEEATATLLGIVPPSTSRPAPMPAAAPMPAPMAAPMPPQAPKPGKSAQERIDAALRFLARSQSASGAFGDTATTALVIAAFAAAGETSKKGTYRRQLSRAESFLQGATAPTQAPATKEQLMAAQRFGGDQDGAVVGLGDIITMTAWLVKLLS